MRLIKTKRRKMMMITKRNKGMNMHYQNTSFSKLRLPLVLVLFQSLLIIINYYYINIIMLLIIVIVICPNHLVQQWQTEIATRTSPPLCVVILTTKNDLTSTTYNGIKITILFFSSFLFSFF